MTNRRRLLQHAALLAAAPVSSALSRPGVAATTANTGEPLKTEITGWSALTLSAAIHRREVSCREVLEAYWRQIERFNPTFNAIVSLAPYETLAAQADLCDTELASGASRGWLHGIPAAPKDLADATGFVTSSGSPIFADHRPVADDIHVARLRAAGALFIGKTNVPEFGLGSQTYNPVFGATGNAYDPALTAGGSSGGAACALALRMLPIADGSDLMGSLRNPAAFNNVIGFRPTPGLVPLGDSFREELAVNGPMGRSVADTARLLATLAGYDERSPNSLPVDPQRFSQPLGRSWKGTRIGWLGDFDGYLNMEQGLLAHSERALPAFEQLGCTVERTQPEFSLAELWEVWLTFRHWLTRSWALPLYRDPKLRAQLKPEAIWEVEGGAKLTGDDISQASAGRAAWYQALLKLFERYDFLALPTTQVYPFSKESHWPRRIGFQPMDTYHRWMEVVVPGTLSGCPVLNLPVGLSDQGLPAGVQLIGKRYGDFELLQFGQAYEAATRFTSDITPPALA